MFKSILLGQSLLFLFVTTCQGQDSLQYKSKFQWKAMAFYNLPISKFSTGAVTDNFITYQDNSISWQVLSFSYFFKKHWGIDASFQLGGSIKNIYNPNDDLANDLSPKFNQFYVTVPFTYWSNNSDPPFVDYNKANVGIIYRIEKGKFSFYPKLSVGITSFSTYSAAAYLKEKNANEVLHLSFTPNQSSSQCYFTVSATSSFAYRIAKNLLLNFDLTASVFKPSLSYTATTTNLNTGASTFQTYDYNQTVSNLSLGLGIILEIDKIKRIKTLGIH